MGAALSPDAPVTLALLNFEAKGLSEVIGDVGLDVLTTYLTNFEYVTLIEREKIRVIIEELELQMSDLTEENGARIGKLLNADKVALCSVGAIGTTYIFNARVVDVETARVVKGRQVVCEECREQDIFDAINLLGTTLAR